MSLKSAIKAIPLTSLDVTAKPYDFTPINPNGIPQNCFLLRVTNATAGGFHLSYGDVANTLLDAGATIELDALRSGKRNAAFKKGTVVSILGVETPGFVYVSGYYKGS